MKINRRRGFVSRKAIAFAAAALAGAALGVGIAVAAITSQTTVADSSAVRLLSVRSAADDLDSGWHKHPGPAIVQVQAGFLKLYQGSCEPTIVGPGETFIEVPELPIRGVAKGHVEWTTTFVIPQGVPPASPVTTDPCA
jgi:hypothetical protein